MGRVNDYFNFKRDLDDNLVKIDNFAQDVNSNFLNKYQITNCILEAPNGVATYVTSNGASTVITKAGLKLLIANGRNADGSLKNEVETLETDVSTPIVIPQAETSIAYSYLIHNAESKTTGYVSRNDYYISDNQPVITRKYGFWYNPKENKSYYSEDYGASWSAELLVLLGYVTIRFNNSIYGEIIEFEPFESVSVLKRSDSYDIAEWAMPSSKYIDLTLGANGSQYIAPATGWIFVQFLNADYVQLYNASCAELYSTAVRKDNYSAIGCYIPVKRGDLVVLYYNNLVESRYFRFIYAKGEIA